MVQIPSLTPHPLRPIISNFCLTHRTPPPPPTPTLSKWRSCVYHPLSDMYEGTIDMYKGTINMYKGTINKKKTEVASDSEYALYF